MRKVKFTELNSGYEVVSKKEASPKKRALTIISIALVAAFVVTFVASYFGILPLEAVSAHIFGGIENYNVSLETDSVVNIKNLGESILVLTDTSVVVYGKNGKATYESVHSFTKPAVSVNGSNAVVFDRSGNGFMLLNENKTVLTSEAEGVVVSAAYGKNGAYALSTRGETSTGTLTVYNSRSDVVFKWNCAYENITSVSLSSGKYVGVSLLGVKDGEYYTTAKIFGFDYSEELSSATISGAAPLSVEFTSPSRLTVFTDTGIYGIEKNSSELITVEEYYNPEFNSIASTSSGNFLIAIADHGSTNSFTVKLYDKKYKLKTEISVNEELKTVSLSDKYIFALAENEILVYNFNGRQVGTVNISGKLYSIYPNDKYIYIYSLDKLTKAYSYGDSTAVLG